MEVLRDRMMEGPMDRQMERPGIGGQGDRKTDGQRDRRMEEGQTDRWREGLTAQEKAKEPTPRSKLPNPICCSVSSVAESQMCTTGCRGWEWGGGVKGGCKGGSPHGLGGLGGAGGVPLHPRTLPSLSTPAACPVATRRRSGCTARLRGGGW